MDGLLTLHFFNAAMTSHFSKRAEAAAPVVCVTGRDAVKVESGGSQTQVRLRQCQGNLFVPILAKTLVRFVDKLWAVLDRISSHGDKRVRV